MKMRLIALICTVALICLATFIWLRAARHRNRFDIILDGPWILYVEPYFDNYGHTVPVLIAIAPIGATSSSKDDEYPYHHLPQLSTGDGYYITTKGIYCLILDDECARRGPTSLSYGHYPKPDLLAIPYHSLGGPSSSWSWVSKSSGNTALILPMPESISQDGAWYMEFSSVFDVDGIAYKELQGRKHSIGLQLHYRNAPATFNLLACNGQPSVANCKTAPTDIPHTQLDNTGTLRIEMKAPAVPGDSACDYHARLAYQQQFQIISNSFNQDYAYIEPALSSDSEGNPIYEGPGYSDYKGPGTNSNPCLVEDPQRNNYHKSTYSTGEQMTPAQMIAEMASNIDRVLENLKNASDAWPRSSKSRHNEQLREIFDHDIQLPIIHARDIAAGLDPKFPRISQLLRVGQLLRFSVAKTNALFEFGLKDTVEDKSRRPDEEYRIDRNKGFINELFQARKKAMDVADGNPTKNGADCRAAVVMMQ